MRVLAGLLAEELLSGIASGRLTDVEKALAEAAAKANAILRENR